MKSTSMKRTSPASPTLIAILALALFFGVAAGGGAGPVEILTHFTAAALPTHTVAGVKNVQGDARGRLYVTSDVAIISSGTTAKAADFEGYNATTGLRLMGVSVRESAGSADVATVVVRLGTADSDPPLLLVELAANQEKFYGLGSGVAAEDGVFVEVVAGTIDMVLFHKVSDDQ